MPYMPPTFARYCTLRSLSAGPQARQRAPIGRHEGVQPLQAVVRSTGKQLFADAILAFSTGSRAWDPLIM